MHTLHSKALGPALTIAGSAVAATIAVSVLSPHAGALLALSLPFAAAIWIEALVDRERACNPMRLSAAPMIEAPEAPLPPPRRPEPANANWKRFPSRPSWV